MPQAQKYRDALEYVFELIADNPRLGIGFDKGNWWWDGEKAQVVVPFGPADQRDLVIGEAYTFEPRNSSKTQWVVAPGVEVKR